MLTPPSSPLPASKQSFPLRASRSPSPLAGPSFIPEKQVISAHATSEEVKRNIGRRMRWAVLVVPLVLILIALSTRYITHLPVMDILSDPTMSWSQMEDNLSDWHLHKRHPAEADAQPTGLIANPGSSTTTDKPQSLPTVPSTPPDVPRPFPQAFDSDIGQNFSSGSCQNFFVNMTNTSPFRSCRPFSLLADTSAEFINAQTNLTLMNTLIWGTCNTSTPADECKVNMDWFAAQMKVECRQELSQRNDRVLSALTDIQAYDMMRKAACLVDPSTNSYCYMSAVINTNPSDLYFYSLPSGIFLPQTTEPTCSACTKSMMALYALSLSEQYPDMGAEVVDETKPLAGLQKTYGASTVLTQNQCGAAYAPTIAASSTGAASQVLPRSFVFVVSAILLYSSKIFGAFSLW